MVRAYFYAAQNFTVITPIKEIPIMTELTSLDHGERIGRLEGIIEQINERLKSLEINHRRDFRWLIGLQLATWATIVGLRLFGG